MGTLFEFLALTDVKIFSLAIAITLGLALLELIGGFIGFSLMGGDADADVDLDIDAGIDADLDLDADVDASVPSTGGAGAVGFLHMLGIAKVPLMVWLITFLCSFGVLGVILQRVLIGVTGFTLPYALAIGIVIVPTILFTRKASQFIAKLVPKLETAAVSADSLIGRVGTVIQGTAQEHLSAEARVYDQHENPHLIRVRPVEGAEPIGKGGSIRLLTREGDFYRVVAG